MGKGTAIIMLAASITFFVLMFACIRKEKILVGFYSQLGVCRRWYAFITGDFLLAGIGAPVVCIVLLVLKLAGKMDDFAWADLLGTFIAGLLAFPIGLLLLRRAKKKCPKELHGRLVKDMIIMMLGTTFRLGLFFMAFMLHSWWKANQPTAYEVDGRIYYAYPGSDDLYDSSGFRKGELTSDHDHAIMD